MNISHRIIFKGTLLTACLLLGCYMMYHMISSTRTALYTFDATLMRFDPIFSQALCSSITTWLEQQTPSLVVYQDLKNQFPAIQSVIAQQKSSGKTVVNIKAVCPCICFNNAMILTTQHTVVSRDCFDTNCIKELPTIAMNASHEWLTPHLMQTLHSIVPHFVERFSITWFDKTRIWFADKTEPSWNMLLDVGSAVHKDLLKRYISVMQAIQEKGIKVKKNQAWVADMRFVDQIIVHGTRGVMYEAS